MSRGNRFGPSGLAGPFQHIQQQPHMPHHANQHHPSGSAGLPPPTFNSHQPFGHAGQGSINSFAAVNNANGLAAGFGGGALGGGTGLASSAAISGFAHGAQIQQQQAREAMRRGSVQTKGQRGNRIRDVWAHNLEEEMQTLRELVEKYPYISMDTEFPGVVARPMGGFTSRADYHYQTLRANVDLLSIIQLGITLFGPDGETPPPHPENGPFQNSATPCPHTWQFNFKFSQDTDMYNQDSIDFLQGVGMNMEMHEVQGIDPKTFGSLLMTSGLAMFEDVRWISFHSGYDFAYLVKLMYCKQLPEDDPAYRRLLNAFFPALYDIKYMVKSAQRTHTTNGTTPLSPNAQNLLVNLGTKGGLQDLADELGTKRVGTAHTAGSDSLLTGKVFWEAKKTIFNGSIDDERYLGQIWGLNGMTLMNAQGGPEGQSTPNLNGATIYAPNTASPSTPQTMHSGAGGTPGPSMMGNGGSLTPGPTGGAFGRFAVR